MKIRSNPLFPAEIVNLTKELGTLWRELATIINGRWGNAVDTTDDVIVDSATSGLVLRDTNGHYWRIKINTTGSLTTTDLGLVKP